MESIRRVHLWEMIRYSPTIFFILESVSKKVKMILESDVSYMQYYLEEMHESENIRHFSYMDCKGLFKDFYTRNYILLNIEINMEEMVLYQKLLLSIQTLMF